MRTQYTELPEFVPRKDSLSNTTSNSDALPLPGSAILRLKLRLHQYASIKLQLHKYTPVAYLYFFFNSLSLPTGLFYTTILSPLFYLWLICQGKRRITLRFVLCLAPFAAAQMYLGINSYFYYARSCILLWTVYITVYAFAVALPRIGNLDRFFDRLITVNFGLAILAVLLIPTPLKELVWNNGEHLVDPSAYGSRLALLTSEPSVYGFLMAPLLVFTVLRLFYWPVRRNLVHVALVATPMLLSQSFGAISICSAGFLIALLSMLPNLLKYRPTRFALLGVAFLLVLLVAVALFIPNPLTARFTAVIAGTDSSVQSRTTHGFALAYLLVPPKQLLWGLGLGQTKLQDVSVLGGSLGFGNAVIPNGIADTFVSLGLVAVILKLAAEIYFFFRFRVFRNTFQLSMYVVTFLLQFTGSNLMNVQEYVMWVMAFTPLFPAMDRNFKMPDPVLPVANTSVTG